MSVFLTFFQKPETLVEVRMQWASLYAIMHELNATGYINNHSRQIAARFLVNELKVDWKKGAAYFEEKLVDYSPASNWGNWAFIAGVNDARESRYNIAALPVAEQAAKNEYIQTWLPASPVLL